MIISSLLFSSCNGSQGKNDTLTTLSVNTESFKKEIKSSAVFSSVKCIPLETGEDFLIDKISKMARKNNHLYVADRLALYKFDLNGSFIAKIEKKGNGPGEYSSISDFEIDTDETVWILSRNDKKLYKYTWNGTLEKEITLNYWAAKMQLISPSEACFYIGNELNENNRHQLKIVDLNQNSITANHLEINPQLAKYLHVNSNSHFCSNRNSGFYFYNLFDNTIYALSKNEILPAFQTDLFGKNIPTSFFDAGYANIAEFFQSLFKGNYAYGTAIFAEYKTRYLYSYYYAKECHISMISKKTNASEVDFTTLIEDKILSNYPIPLTGQDLFILQDNNALALPLIPSEIALYAEDNLNGSNKNSLLQAIQYTSEHQNPVILILE